MDKQFIEMLKPLMGLRAPFDVFAIGDGSGVFFCSACGRRSDLPVEGLPQPITHKSDCRREAHYRAIAALKQAMVDAGIE